jgi:hypothetical protein
LWQTRRVTTIKSSPFLVLSVIAFYLSVIWIMMHKEKNCTFASEF